MNCSRCHALPGYLAGPWGPAGPETAPVLLIAQNPPQRLPTCAPGAFRLHVVRTSPPGRLEKAVDGLLRALALAPGDVRASQAFLCATKQNAVVPAMVRACADHLAAEVHGGAAGLHVTLGKVAAAAYAARVLRHREVARVRMPVRGGVDQVYEAVVRLARLRGGRTVRWLALPHAATAVRFVLPGAWEATARTALDNAGWAFPPPPGVGYSGP